MSYSIQPISFSSYKNQADKAKHELILSEQDEQLEKQLEKEALYIAKLDSVKKADKTLKKGLATTIATDVFVNGTSMGTGLASKTANTLSRTGAWGGAFAVASLYNKAIEKVCDQSESIAQARKEHPIATAFMYMVGGLASMTGVDYLYHKAKNAVSETFPEQVGSLTEKINSIKTSMDKSWVNKEIVAPVKNLSAQVAKNMPTVTKAIEKTAPYAPLGIFAYTFAKGINQNENTKNKKNEVYKELKQARESALLNASIAKINELDAKSNALFYITSNLSNQVNSENNTEVESC